MFSVIYLAEGSALRLESARCGDEYAVACQLDRHRRFSTPLRRNSTDGDAVLVEVRQNHVINAGSIEKGERAVQYFCDWEETEGLELRVP